MDYNGRGAKPQITVAKVIGKCRGTLSSIGVISLVINLLMLTGPMFMLQVYDRVLSSHSLPTLAVIAALVGGLYVAYGLLEGIRSRMLTRFAQEVDLRLSAKGFGLNLKLPLGLGARGRGQEPLRDLESIRQFCAGPGPAAMFDVPWMPIYLGLVFALHFWLGLIALGGAVLIFLLVLANEFLSRAPAKQMGEASAQRSRFASGARTNAEVVKAMGMGPRFTTTWLGMSDKLYQTQQKAGDRAAFFTVTIKTLRFILQSGMLAVAAWLTLLQEVSPGAMIASSIITSRALAPIEAAVGQWRAFVGARQARTRLDKLLAAIGDTQPETELPLPKQKLEILQLATAPVGERVPTFQGGNFVLNAGDGLAVIGPSGSGKTSLIRALVGVWPLLRGKLTLDGAEPQQWQEERLGAAIGYLPQDVELFDGTIAENIARFAAQRNNEAILEAARLAHVHELITSFNEGYDTRVGVGGARLSAGQRQRIGLARALYNKPFLVVLDEPNSNLDSEGEAALTAAIKTMRQAGSIVVVVAHRPSALAALDLVVVVKEGTQQMFGAKDEVLPKVMAGPALGASSGQPLQVVQK
ncbi:type I secretion system permease/ATPase [Polycladidibacter stylochi]|uniref:type I secretion system permease/ATPase n=1 Tax=Polycladidibacter stylochi TaxID=1807766 RepID=UPI00083567F1|nr:type I secretion system permease/ATPase [Pseudovibrio stylochi]